MKFLTGNIFQPANNNKKVVVVNPLNTINVATTITQNIKEHSPDAYHYSILDANEVWDSAKSLFGIKAIPTNQSQIIINAFVYQARSFGPPDDHLFNQLLEYIQNNLQDCVVRIPYMLGTTMTNEAWNNVLNQMQKRLRNMHVEIWKSDQ